MFSSEVYNKYKSLIQFENKTKFDLLKLSTCAEV